MLPFFFHKPHKSTQRRTLLRLINTQNALPVAFELVRGRKIRFKICKIPARIELVNRTAVFLQIQVENFAVEFRSDGFYKRGLTNLPRTLQQGDIRMLSAMGQVCKQTFFQVSLYHA